ncbi:MAG: PadR family transcriptional regulator [Christensenella sp.]|uniref:PadR family transcriptional regulator n=1 Tax=Christensenella sp. TaxID=1935934 RepID=UPI002B2070C7|nr:PadR family transcriptional regulator [Christensenella sp.]MEA5002620.1 PadR family transcriptional regulator [Christensenella sp.]
MDTPQEILNGLLQELRRGTIVMSVLSQLNEPRYGYSLVQRLNDAGMPTEAGTLYPLLRRLEKQGLLKSEWETSGAKPRKYYAITQEGMQIYEKLLVQWDKMSAVIGRMTGEE